MDTSRKHRLREALREAHRKESYGDISERVFKGKVNKAIIWRIVTMNKWPKSPELRRLLCLNPEPMLADLKPEELLRRLNERYKYS